MSALPLIFVTILVIWLRFRIGERARGAAIELIGLVLREHGTDTLFNGTPSRQSYKPAMNRHARRAAKRQRQ